VPDKIDAETSGRPYGVPPLTPAAAARSARRSGCSAEGYRRSRVLPTVQFRSRQPASLNHEGDITVRARWGVGKDRRTPGTLGAGERWLTVVSPDDPDRTSLLLAPLNEAAKALRAHRRATGTPALSFTVDKCQRYRDLRDRSVMSEPEAMGYGRTDAVFEDRCGNALNPDQNVPAGVGGDATE
jgi:hypothetical protein